MSRYIDADKLWKDTTTYFDYCEEYLELIEKQPTADVVEVVRCEDCVNWQDDWYTSHDGYHYCAMIDIIIDGDFYCKDGERKILPKD